MYKRQAYKYHDLMYTETGKNTVLPKFLEDITNCKPTNIRPCKTIIYIAFHGKYSVVYTLPIKAYNKITGGDIHA